MHELTIIGFGNTLRQDDGFGPAVIERLRTLVDDDPRIQLLAPSTLTPELAAILADSRSAIFVDACATLAPGQTSKRRVAADADADPSLVHFLSPEALLVWTERLYQRCPESELWLVGTKETGLSETLTDAVESKVDEFVSCLQRRVRAALDPSRDAAP